MEEVVVVGVDGEGIGGWVHKMGWESCLAAR